MDRATLRSPQALSQPLRLALCLGVPMGCLHSGFWLGVTKGSHSGKLEGGRNEKGRTIYSLHSFLEPPAALAQVTTSCQAATFLQPSLPPGSTSPGSQLPPSGCLAWVVIEPRSRYYSFP